ncbi:hypothetical protein [Patiriisocius marinus]|uniref:Lipoprotein n=1 Tax=Patiriisocius marinus TaxID=1397112 RepID=A0A5J4J0E2_9FLAO|nr:hypothetical protein [Patiriisocius marinus]GER57977.1 hypothetical protein ULMA_00850 [Patiriisocius marinus]
MNQLFKLFIAVVVLTVSSCTVTESIVFNENMGGTYKNSYDLSTIMKMAGGMTPPSEGKEKTKMDTLINFNDFMVAFKDSIATLPEEKQAQLLEMKDMTLHLNMDEDTGIFVMEVSKPFKNFSDIEFVSYQMDDMFAMAKEQTGQSKTGNDSSGSMLEADKVTYKFTDNTFRRVDPKLLIEEGDTFDRLLDTDENQTEEEKKSQEMMDEMLGQFDEMLEESSMTLTYTFPKKIKSVSHKNAIISGDGKTVTFTTDIKTITKDKKLLSNFEVVLEE